MGGEEVPPGAGGHSPLCGRAGVCGRAEDCLSHRGQGRAGGGLPSQACHSVPSRPNQGSTQGLRPCRCGSPCCGSCGTPCRGTCGTPCRGTCGTPCRGTSGTPCRG